MRLHAAILAKRPFLPHIPGTTFLNHETPVNTGRNRCRKATCQICIVDKAPKILAEMSQENEGLDLLHLSTLVDAGQAHLVFEVGSPRRGDCGRLGEQ
jgi:hypothetical protein